MFFDSVMKVHTSLKVHTSRNPITKLETRKLENLIQFPSKPFSNHMTVIEYVRNVVNTKKQKHGTTEKFTNNILLTVLPLITFPFQRSICVSRPSTLDLASGTDPDPWPQFLFSSLGPQFVFNFPASNLYLPSSALNIYWFLVS